MLSVLLITPHYSEMNTPAGLYTAALAHAYSDRGHDVHVLCTKSSVPPPTLFSPSRITLHRFELRAESSEPAFACQAARCILDLIRADKCDVIECIDSPSSELTALFFAHTGGMNAPIISISTQSTQTPKTHSAIDQSKVPFPLHPKAWNPPNVEGPLLIACDAQTPADHLLIANAYDHSGIHDLGWSLALPDSHGYWSILSGAKLPSTDQPPRRVAISQGNGLPIIAVHMILAGGTCIFEEHSTIASMMPPSNKDGSFVGSSLESIAIAMRRTAEQSDSDYNSNSRSMVAGFADRHDFNTIARAHEALWDAQPVPLNRSARTALWKQLESRTHTQATITQETLHG